MTAAEKKLAIDSLTIRRAMNLDCLNIAKGSRREHYRVCLAKIDAELAELTEKGQRAMTNTFGKEWGTDKERIQAHIEAADHDQAVIDFRNGRIRGLEGARQSDNPYPKGKPGHGDWERGRRFVATIEI